MSTFRSPEPDRLAALCRRWKISKLSLFGSVARGEEGPDSDVDFLVEFAPDANWSLIDASRMHREFAELFGRPVDLVQEIDVTNPYRLSSIRRDRRAFYAA